MMNNRQIYDRWFGGLSGVQLERMFPDILDQCTGDFNDFIDDCDEWWDSQSFEKKERIYNHFHNW